MGQFNEVMEKQVSPGKRNESEDRMTPALRSTNGPRGRRKRPATGCPSISAVARRRARPTRLVTKGELKLGGMRRKKPAPRAAPGNGQHRGKELEDVFVA